MLSVLINRSEEAKQDALKQLAEMMDPLRAARESTSIAVLAEEVATVIALLTPKPIFPLGQWYQRPENIPIVGQLGSWSWPTANHPFCLPIEIQVYPTNEIQRLVRRYLALQNPIRRRLRTPLIRLNQSRMQLDHHTVEAAAIDLGIAIEALLGEGRENDARISFVMRVRGTLLLGGSSQTRKQTYNALQDVYKLRSTVAHTGIIADRRDIPFSENARRALSDPREQVRVGRRICGDMIIQVITSGGFPDWDALLLGGVPEGVSTDEDAHA